MHFGTSHHGLQGIVMSFTQEGKTHTIKGITSSYHEIIMSHCMENLLKKFHWGLIAQFNAIWGVDNTPPKIHLYFQLVLSKNQRIFQFPRGLTPSHGEHDHGIPLIPGSQPPNVHPYRHPFL